MTRDKWTREEREAYQALEPRCWDPPGKPIEYAAWIKYAGNHPEQNRTWRSHELLARQNYAGQEDYELGGEA